MRHATRIRTATRWTIVILRVPYLGHLVRLEDGPLYRGPATLFGLSWWWRPTGNSAVLKALAEIEKSEADR